MDKIRSNFESFTCVLDDGTPHVFDHPAGSDLDLELVEPDQLFKVNSPHTNYFRRFVKHKHFHFAVKQMN